MIHPKATLMTVLGIAMPYEDGGLEEDGYAPVMVSAEQSATPGLYITPQLGFDDDGNVVLADGYSVTHSCGFCVPLPGMSLYTARKAAEKLAEITDWTADRETILAKMRDNPEASAQFDAIAELAAISDQW